MSAASRMRILVWSLVVAVGLLRLGSPLDGDQALFLFYASWLDRGLHLYVDLWDNKQPGVFWFYWAAGRFLGFNSVGLHILEWFWMAAAGCMLLWAARLEFGCAWVAELVPLFTVGLYYWCASTWFMTQVEGLVALPLAGCVLASVLAVRRPLSARWMHAAFGLCMGLVVVLKIVLVVVPIALLLVMIPYAGAAQGGRKLYVDGWALGATLCGAALPLGGVAWYFIHNHAWGAFFLANFVWPRLALQENEGKSLWTLLRAARWWLTVSLPSVFLVFKIRRDFGHEQLRLIEAMAVAWLFAGIAAILVQRISWWGYHFLLLLWPMGLIGASAADRLLSRRDATDDKLLRESRRIVAIAAMAMFAVYPMQAVRGAAAAVKASMSSYGTRLEAFQDVIDPKSTERRQLVARLRERAADWAEELSTIYAFGNPNWMLAFDLPQALPIHGWAWEIMLERQWAELPAQLSAAQPALLYIDDDYAKLIARRSPATFEFVMRAYTPVLRTSEPGTWYERVSTRPGERDSPSRGEKYRILGDAPQSQIQQSQTSFIFNRDPQG